MEADTANIATPFGFQYNNQETLPSRYVRHQQVYLYPTQQNSVSSSSAAQNPNPVVKFLLPPNGFLDTKSSYLAFNASAKSDTNTDILYFVDSTDAWINRILLLTPGGNTIEEVRNANTLASIDRRDVEPVYEQSVGRACLNMLQSTGISATTRMNRSKQNLRYVAELGTSGFLSDAYSYLPLKCMAGQNSNALQLEIQFATLQQMLIGTAANGLDEPVGPYNYSISNIVFVANIIYDDMKEMQLMEQIKSTPIVLSYKTRMNYAQPLQNSTSSTTQIAEFQEQVLSLDTVFIPNSNINSIQADFTKFSNPPNDGVYPTKGCAQYQAQIGSDYFPAQPVILTTTSTYTTDSTTTCLAYGEQYYNYAITNQKQRKYNKGFYPTTFSVTHALPNTSTNDFIISTDFRIVADDAIGDPMYFQYYAGKNLKMNPQPIQLKLSFTDAPGNNHTIYNFTKYISNLVIQSNELYIVS